MYSIPGLRTSTDTAKKNILDTRQRRTMVSESRKKEGEPCINPAAVVRECPGHGKRTGGQQLSKLRTGAVPPGRPRWLKFEGWGTGEKPAAQGEEPGDLLMALLP